MLSRFHHSRSWVSADIDLRLLSRLQSRVANRRALLLSNFLFPLIFRVENGAVRVVSTGECRVLAAKGEAFSPFPSLAHLLAYLPPSPAPSLPHRSVQVALWRVEPHFHFLQRSSKLECTKKRFPNRTGVEHSRLHLSLFPRALRDERPS